APPQSCRQGWWETPPPPGRRPGRGDRGRRRSRAGPAVAIMTACWPPAFRHRILRGGPSWTAHPAYRTATTRAVGSESLGTVTVVSVTGLGDPRGTPYPQSEQGPARLRLRLTLGRARGRTARGGHR